MIHNYNNYNKNKTNLMNDLTGWSLSEVKTYAKLTGIKLDYHGYGYVTGQSIEPGTEINAESQLEIQLDK